MMLPALVVICTCKFCFMIADSSLSLHCKSIVVHLWHIPCIDMVYPCHILLLSLPSHNFPVKPLHPTKELFCASQLLIEALDAFELMETRFYLENIYLGYTRYIPGISTEKVYTWYIPGIYHEKTLWGFQMSCVSYVPVRTGTYHYRMPVLACTCTYQYVLVHTSTYDFA